MYPHSGAFNGVNTFVGRNAVLAGAQGLNWLFVSEVTGDFAADLIARHNDGSLIVYPGTGRLQGLYTFDAPVVVGTGWGGVTAISVADATGDGDNDLIVRWGDGNLFVYEHTGIFDSVNTWAGPELIGTGWNIMDWIGAAEATSDDEKPDLLGRRVDNGTLQMYPRTRWYNGASTFVGPVQVGTGWNTVQIMALMAVTIDRFTDIVARRSNGELVVYSNAGGYDGDFTFRSPVILGTGWNAMDLIA